jgi:hypothetical protein
VSGCFCLWGGTAPAAASSSWRPPGPGSGVRDGWGRSCRRKYRYSFGYCLECCRLCPVSFVVAGHGCKSCCPPMFAERQFARKSFAGTRFEIRLLARRFPSGLDLPQVERFMEAWVSRASSPARMPGAPLVLCSSWSVYLWPLCRQETAVDCRNSLGAR